MMGFFNTDFKKNMIKVVEKEKQPVQVTSIWRDWPFHVPF